MPNRADQEHQDHAPGRADMSADQLRQYEDSTALLREHSRKLDTALNNMSQGLCMYDADARHVLCNRRYLEIMDLSAEFAVPGRTLREMIFHRQQTGADTGDPEQVSADILAAIAAGKTVLHLVETGDGRTVRVINQPIDGGGWVATFDDITDQRQAERERDRNQAFLNTVINNVPATIFVQDARDRRYLLINGAGEKYLGVTREQMIGKTPRELFS